MACGVVCKTPHFVLHRWNPALAPEAAPFVEGRLLLGALTPKLGQTCGDAQLDQTTNLRGVCVVCT